MSCLSGSEDEIVVVGGRNIKSVEIFDPAVGSWRYGELKYSYNKKKQEPTTLMDKTLYFSGTDFPGPISEHSQTIFGDSFIIAGGREYANDIRYKKVYR